MKGDLRKKLPFININNGALAEEVTAFMDSKQLNE